MAKIVADGKGAVFGRVASFVAKELLKGNSVELINCESILVSGNVKVFADKILQKRAMGAGSSLKGPTYPRQADRLVKRMIRGMLPWDRPKGRTAYKRLRCYVADGGLAAPNGVPPAANEGGKDLKDVKVFDHQKPMKYSTIKDVVRIIKNERA